MKNAKNGTSGVVKPVMNADFAGVV